MDVLGPGGIAGIVIACIALAIGGSIWCVCAQSSVSSFAYWRNEDAPGISHC